MEFWDNINDVVKNMGDRAIDLIETAKLSARIMAEKKEVSDELEKIGTYYYELYARGGIVAPEVAELSKTVKNHYDAIDRFQAEIDRLRADQQVKKTKYCPACGIKVSSSTRYCSGCGELLLK
ncbi:MAG: zinc ribbon domain-containing protein [Oscillospiraceae bacterium]|nr:zinc ribbon domain-containing protein [Oscillospiraceae bacterium]